VLKRTIAVRSTEGLEFDCYLVLPEVQQPVPAVVLASSIHGVDNDLRAIADELASRGVIAAAPDLFWRTVGGPLARGDPRAARRGQPRLEKIRTGEEDLADVLAMVHRQPFFNGRAVLLGFCYGGPYAIIGPKRLGYAAGMSCHGSQMLDFVTELQGIERPVCIDWGNQDDQAPVNVREAYRAVRSECVQVHVFAGVRHGYMMQGNAAAFDRASYKLSIEHALAILDRLRSARA
jgi:carboxymethylenebutenolidase